MIPPAVDPARLPPPPVLPGQPPELAEAKFDFTGNSEKELSVAAGTVCQVVRRLQSGWTLVQVDGRTGAVPSSYLAFSELPAAPPSADQLPPPPPSASSGN